MAMYYDVRPLRTIRNAAAFIILALAIPAISVVAADLQPDAEASPQQEALPQQEASPQHIILTDASGIISYASEIKTAHSELKSAPSVTNSAATASLADQAEAGLRRALAVMATRQWSGGWANGWNIDGRVVWGEYRPIPHLWLTVQPPATPGIARIYVRAAEILNDDSYLHHARLAKQALLAVQSDAGGFPDEAAPSSGPSPTGTFDDNTTTGALDFLIELWQYTGDEAARQAVLSVGEFMLVSQYPGSGGWPQIYPPRPDHYSRHITFNDRAMTNVIKSLLRLYELFGDTRYLEAARRGGECIIRLQGPPGEEIWGQQHDPETLLPAPARAFEPAGYTAGESRAVIEALIELYLATGEERFLEPIPKALAWYDANRLPNGNWARYYEPGTGRPIYGDRDGQVYYRLEDISQERQEGYSWEGNYYPHAAKQAYDRIREIGRTAYLAEQQQNQPTDVDKLAQDVLEVLEAQHPDGWWTVHPGFGLDSGARHRNSLEEAGVEEDAWELVWSGTFVRNARLLLDYIEAGK